MEEKELIKAIKKELLKYKINTFFKGYRYLVLAILYWIKHDAEDDTMRVSIGEVLLYVAAKNRKSTKTVRSCMELLIKNSELNTSLGNFISIVSEEVKSNL